MQGVPILNILSVIDYYVAFCNPVVNEAREWGTASALVRQPLAVVRALTCYYNHMLMFTLLHPSHAPMPACCCQQHRDSEVLLAWCAACCFKKRVFHLIFLLCATATGLSASSLHHATSCHSAMLSSASQCDSSLPSRLECKTIEGTSHVTNAVSNLISEVSQCAPGFVSTAAAHKRRVDKRLEMLIEELDHNVKLLEACLQHSYACDSDLESSAHTVAQLVTDSDIRCRISHAITPSGHNALDRVRTASCIVDAIDSHRSTVSHPRWLARGERTRVSISVVDADGEPVHGVTPSDISVTVDGKAAGWESTLVDATANVLSFEVKLTDECSDDADVRICIWTTVFTLALKVSAYVCSWSTVAKASYPVVLYRPLRHMMP